MLLAKQSAFLTAIALVSFLAGKWSHGGVEQSNKVSQSSSQAEGTHSQPANIRSNNEQALRRVVQKIPQITDRESKLAVFRRAALLGDIGRQASVLCELVENSDLEELEEMTELLKQYQSRGNSWDQEVWNELWKQWGRVDPQRCLQMAREGKGMVHGGDYEQLMSGWIEVDPRAAEEWVASLPSGYAEKNVAAYFVAKGQFEDPEAMAFSILEGTQDDAVRDVSAHRYLDYCVSLPDLSLEDIYEHTPTEYRPYVAGKLAERMSYLDPVAAADWVLAQPQRGEISQQSILKLVKNIPEGVAVRRELETLLTRNFGNE